jgi:hypothetical protein
LFAANRFNALIACIRFSRFAAVALALLLIIGGVSAQDGGLLDTLIASGQVSPDSIQSPFTSNLCFLSTVSAKIGYFLNPSDPLNPSGGPNASAVSVSADGRYIAFQSDADNLVDASSIGGADTNRTTDIFRYDRLTCTIERVSLNSNNQQTVNTDNPPIIPWSRRPSISADGRYVSFTSIASNLDAEITDNNTNRDIFVRDMVNRTTIRVSISSPNNQGQRFQTFGPSDGSTISANGRYVTFYSSSSGLLATGLTFVNGVPVFQTSDTNNFCQHDTDPDLDNCYDIFVHDTVTRLTERVSVANDGAEANNDSGQTVLSIATITPIDHIGISADGRYVAFFSRATNLVPGDTNGVDDIFVRDRVANTTTRVSVSSAGAQAINGHSIYPDISNDGRFVAFESKATNLITSDLNGTFSDIFVHDRSTGITSIASITSFGQQVAQDNYQPSISSDGRYVSFTSNSSFMLATENDNNGLPDVYVHDRDPASLRTKLVSSNFNGFQGTGGSFVSEISDDGQYVAFESDAINLVNGDSNSARDTFVTYWQNISFEPGANMLVNPNFNLGMTAWGIYGEPIYPEYNVQNGVFQFYRQSSSTQGVILQNTHNYLWANSPIEAQVQVANTSDTRKRFTMLLHDGDFSDLQLCSFYADAGQPPRNYIMRAKTNEAWTNAAISIYASDADNKPFLQIDNVRMVYNPNLAQIQTLVECVDPNAPTTTIPNPDSSNLIVNGTFDGGTFAPWGRFDPGGVVALNVAVAGGVLEMYRPIQTNPAPSLLQNTGVTTITDGMPLELRLSMGNSSAVRKRVIILIHESDFSNLQACVFWLPPGAPLEPYVIRTYAPSIDPGWESGITVSFYIGTVDNLPAIRVDNVELRSRPSLAVSGLSCYLPGSGALMAGRPAYTLAPYSEPIRTSDMPISEPMVFVNELPLPPADGEGSLSEHGDAAATAEPLELLPTATATVDLAVTVTADATIVETPTDIPTETPTPDIPTLMPTETPTETPTFAPTETPTLTLTPTETPTLEGGSG